MKTLEVREFEERISEILRIVQEDSEMIEVTNHGKVIARPAPVRKAVSSTESTEDTVWADLDRLSTEISTHWPEGLSAVDAVPDVRREL